MRGFAVALLTMLALVGLHPPAYAKGAGGASISGPGLGPEIVLDSGDGDDGEPGSDAPLGRLAEMTGLFPAAFGQRPNPMSDVPPPGELGPAYTITWTMPGSEGDDTLVQLLYPYAENGPATFMEPGQPFFGAEATHGGWYDAGTRLATFLTELGLPASPPGPAVPLLPVILAAAVAALGAAAGLAVRRRRTAQPARIPAA